MTEGEKAFLAFTMVGVFSMDHEGRLWKHRRLIAGSRIGTPPYWKEIKPKLAARSKSDGYPTVMFSDKKVRHKVFAHRVVWMIANRSDIPAGMEINHRNGRRGDTRPVNLELMTPAQNAMHAIHVLGRPKLTKEAVLRIRSLSGEVAESQMAMMFGVTQRTISAIVRRETWAEIR